MAAQFNFEILFWVTRSPFTYTLSISAFPILPQKVLRAEYGSIKGTQRSTVLHCLLAGPRGVSSFHQGFRSSELISYYVMLLYL